MTDFPELRDGDKVAVTFNGTVRTINGHQQVTIPTVGPWRVAHLREQAIKVEVTLRADHPSHDPPGTVRAGQGRVWVKVPPYGNGETGVWWDLVTHEEITGDDVQDYPVVHSALVALVRVQRERHAGSVD